MGFLKIIIQSTARLLAPPVSFIIISFIVNYNLEHGIKGALLNTESLQILQGPWSSLFQLASLVFSGVH